jgi:pantoate kinase
MVRSAVAFSPGHISGYFKRIYGPSYAETGSIGAGIVITEGVSARVVSADETAVEVRRLAADGTLIERQQGSAPIEYVIGKLGVRASVTTECRLPIGAGFGLSAAALLATITALDALFSLRMAPAEIALLAHEAEIVHNTGLGDVAACQDGGMVCRRGPGIGAEILRDFSRQEPLYAVTFGSLETAGVLTSPAIMARIDAAFPDRCPADINEFFALSARFAEESGLVSPAVEEVLGRCRREGVPASMTMLGNGVFACGSDAAGILAGYGEVIPLGIATGGVRLIEVLQ